MDHRISRVVVNIKKVFMLNPITHVDHVIFNSFFLSYNHSQCNYCLTIYALMAIPLIQSNFNIHLAACKLQIVILQ